MSQSYPFYRILKNQWYFFLAKFYYQSTRDSIGIQDKQYNSLSLHVYKSPTESWYKENVHISPKDKEEALKHMYDSIVLDNEDYQYLIDPNKSENTLVYAIKNVKTQVEYAYQVAKTGPHQSVLHIRKLCRDIYQTLTTSTGDSSQNVFEKYEKDLDNFRESIERYDEDERKLFCIFAKLYKAKKDKRKELHKKVKHVKKKNRKILKRIEEKESELEEKKLEVSKNREILKREKKETDKKRLKAEKEAIINKVSNSQSQSQRPDDDLEEKTFNVDD